jgi:predicted nucleic acid-binding Zn ribbon protein
MFSTSTGTELFATETFCGEHCRTLLEHCPTKKKKRKKKSASRMPTEAVLLRTGVQ